MIMELSDRSYTLGLALAIEREEIAAEMADQAGEDGSWSDLEGPPEEDRDGTPWVAGDGTYPWDREPYWEG